uniref:Uncharacterized protein n=1 Tax=Anguilla anguilla TaxID=7936 RepID=A0A0E9QQV5_ANGAN
MRGWCCCTLPQHTWPEPAADIACLWRLGLSIHQLGVGDAFHHLLRVKDRQKPK